MLFYYYWSALLIFLSFQLRGIVPELTSWTHDHQKCFTTHHHNSPKHNSGIREYISCHDLEYYKYIKQYLHENTDNGTYKYLLLSTIAKMYDDLKISRLPQNVSLPGGAGKSVLIHPISFGIPEASVQPFVPPKSQAFCSVIPGKKSTYIWDERKYYVDLQSSLFVVTFKKSGWDCFRHLEILASGSLPLFINIQSCPPAAMALHPKNVYQALLSFPGLLEAPQLVAATDYSALPQSLSFDWSRLDADPDLYRVAAEALLQFARNVLSCERVAVHLLETVAPSLARARRARGSSSGTHPQQMRNRLTDASNDSSSRPPLSSSPVLPPPPLSFSLPRSILFLTHQHHGWLDHGDYMVDLLLLGLKGVLDPAAVLDFPRRNPLYKDGPLFNESAYLRGKDSLYGKGYTYGQRLTDALRPEERREEAVLQRLRRRGFDLVLLASAHVTDKGGAALPSGFWEAICDLYDPSEVVVVDGGDDQLNNNILHRYASCAQHWFSREGYRQRQNPHERDGTLLKEFKGRVVYLMEAGLRRPFVSSAAFAARGFDFGNITGIHEYEMATIPVGSPVS